MSGAVSSVPLKGRLDPDRTLRAAASLWFVVALVGQWAFVVYIAIVYGGTAAMGNFAHWSHTSLRGYVAGDTVGNLVFGAHVSMAAVLTLGGAAQLVPAIRQRAAGFHRWNGRVFLATAFAISLGGLYLVWIRLATSTLLTSIGISLNAALILGFGAMAWRRARARDLGAHRRWALRTFMAANGVWFIRLGYMAWTLLNGGPVGMTDNLDGPFDVFISFGAYLIPLAVLEGYLRTQDRGGRSGKYVMAAGLVATSVLTALGVFGATAFMWGSQIARVLGA